MHSIRSVLSSSSSSSSSSRSRIASVSSRSPSSSSSSSHLVARARACRASHTRDDEKVRYIVTVTRATASMRERYTRASENKTP